MFKSPTSVQEVPLKLSLFVLLGAQPIAKVAVCVPEHAHATLPVFKLFTSVQELPL